MNLSFSTCFPRPTYLSFYNFDYQDWVAQTSINFKSPSNSKCQLSFNCHLYSIEICATQSSIINTRFLTAFYNISFRFQNDENQ